MSTRHRHNLLIKTLKIIVDQSLIYRLPNSADFLDAVAKLATIDKPLPKDSTRALAMVNILEATLDKCADLLPKSKIQPRYNTVRNLIRLILQEPNIRSSDPRLAELWKKPATPLSPDNVIMKQIKELVGDTSGKIS